MKLVITEKPSVAQTIAKVLGATHRGNGYIENNNYIISWCIGHLVSLATPECYGEEFKDWHKLPIIPTHWLYTINPKTKAQFSILKKLMNDKRVTSVVCATDAGREGELIFRLVYNQAKCNKPIERLWISSLEDKAILNGFENLKSGKEYDNLYASALCRERADWLIGINSTRHFTVNNGNNGVISIGRVQTPTLAMIVQRDLDIANFVRSKYYTVEINCGEFTATSEKFTDLEQAKAVEKSCQVARAIVTDIKRENKATNPPKLYDLTALQRDANKLYGFTAQQTLTILQKLYEAKLVTYPRTDSRYLTDDMEITADEVIKSVIGCIDFTSGIDYTPNIKLTLDSSKVSDHHAIIPTTNVKNNSFTALGTDEIKLLYMVITRLLTATAPKYQYESTTVTLNCNNNLFTASGKTVTNKGFKAIEERLNDFANHKSEDNNTAILPDISNNEYAVTSKLLEHFTQPPKPYTEDTLLSAMERAGNENYTTDDVERKGLGTPATRANIIETLVFRGYIERKGKNLVSTDKGRNLINIVPEILKSAKMTADWENRLTLIAKGTADDKKFMRDIEQLVVDTVLN